MTRRKPRYNDDSDYTTNAPSYYDDLARKQKLIKELSLRIWEYDKTLSEGLENIENVLDNYINIVDGKIELIDQKIGEGFNNEIDILLREWVNDGTLNHIINEEIFNTKADTETMFDMFSDSNDKFLYNRISANRKRKPVMSIVDDDGRIELWTKIKPYIEEKKIPITSAIITSRIDKNNLHVTSEQMKAMSELKDDDGRKLFDFVSHTNNHEHLQQSSDTVIHETCFKSRKWLLDRGYNGDVIVYPYGIADYNARSIVAQYFQIGMLSDRGDSEVNQIPLDSYGIQRAYLENGIQQIKDRIDKIADDGGWLILGTHAHYEDFSIEELDEIVNYAIFRGVAIENVKNAIRYYGNLAESGSASTPTVSGFVIGADGEIYGRTLGRYRRGSFQDGLFDRSIKEFPPDAILEGYIQSKHGGDFPESSGIYKVNRHRNDSFSYSEFLSLGGNLYRRFWNTTNDKWNSFYLVSQKVRGKVNRNISIGTIGSNNSTIREIDVPASWLNNSFSYNVEPMFEIPNGIIFNHYKENGKLYLKINNTLEESYTFVSTTNWDITGIKTS